MLWALWAHRTGYGVIKMLSCLLVAVMETSNTASDLLVISFKIIPMGPLPAKLAREHFRPGGLKGFSGSSGCHI